LSSTKERYSRW